MATDFYTAICDDYISGLSSAEVARIHGMSASGVRVVLRRFGVPLRGKKEATLLKCTDGNWIRKRADKLVGRPSGALGKKWKVPYQVQKPTLRGAGNAMWKGGLTSLNRKIRGLDAYMEWRKAVFARDNATCVICEASGHGSRASRAKLEADHIIPLHVLLMRYSITTTFEAAACAELWDVSNGRTLCADCHRRTETWGANPKKTKKAA